MKFCIKKKIIVPGNTTIGLGKAAKAKGPLQQLLRRLAYPVAAVNQAVSNDSNTLVYMLCTALIGFLCQRVGNSLDSET